MIVVASQHARDRIRERTGLPKRAASRLAAKAYADGFGPDRFHGPMHAYLTAMLPSSRADTLRVYDDFVYLFGGSDPVRLVTCWPLHEHFHGAKPLPASITATTEIQGAGNPCASNASRAAGQLMPT